MQYWLDLKEMNELLSNLNYPSEKVMTFVKQETIKEMEDGEEQGGENIYNKIYVLKKYPNIYLKIEWHTDSYGDNDSVFGIQFVAPVEKLVTVYEPI